MERYTKTKATENLKRLAYAGGNSAVLAKRLFNSLDMPEDEKKWLAIDLHCIELSGERARAFEDWCRERYMK